MDSQENRGDVITTISHRSEIVDPILENLKALTVVSYYYSSFVFPFSMFFRLNMFALA